MVSDSVLHRLEAEFDDAPESIRNVVRLLEEGASVPFIGRFRRDETGDVGEDRIAAIEERWHFLQDLDARKAAIRQQAEERGQVTDSLRESLASTFDQDLLDDIYQSFRPRRRTIGMQAEEKGVGPLAEAIHHRQLGDRTLQDVAEEYVSEERGLPTPEAVLEAVLYVLSERYAGDPSLRAQVRDELSRGILKARATAPDRKGAQRYKDFFAFEEPVRRIGAGRMLALRRAEREGIVRIELCLPEGREIEIFRGRFAADLTEDGTLREFLDLVFRHAYDNLVRPACEADIRRRIKEKADRETVRTFARNLRSQLMAPPLGPKRVLAVRASSKTAWIAAVDEDGSLSLQRTLHLAEETGPEPGEAPAAAAGPSAGPDAEGAAAPAAAPEHAGSDQAPLPPGASAPESGGADAAPAAGTEPPTQAEAAAPGEAEPGAEAASGGGSAGPAAAAASEGSAEPAAERASEPAAVSAETPSTAPEDGPSLEKTCTAEEAETILAETVERVRPAAFAIPHGRRQDMTSRLVQRALQRVGGEKPLVVPVDEATSAIYATSASGRKALPNAEVGIRTAVSLGRRLQDPMLELLGMDPRELGIGHHLGDVHQGMLARQLDAVVGSCLARVGVDLNRAGVDLLARLPALSREVARRVVEWRKKHGGFRSIEQLRQVEGVDDVTFRDVAGFVRVVGGDEPLDATAVHPESYDLARRIAAAAGSEAQALLGKDFKRIDLSALDAEFGSKRVRDTLDAMRFHGRDPRGVLTTWSNEGVRSLDDLVVDMELRGRVTNLTEFGAFVDLGIGQDGLVHVSQIPGSRLRDPDRMLRVGEVITVYVVRIDKKGRKISLTMLRPRHVAEGRSPTLGERLDKSKRPRRGRREQTPVMSRAARAPEGRRGDRRGPRRQGGRGPGQDLGRDLARGPRGGGSDSRGPRVITVESERPVEESLGHKGELRSLSGLRQLLQRERDQQSGDRES